MGIPSDREQYIHRLGRTGREDKEGEGVLLIAPWEEYFLDEIKDLPLQNFPLPDINPHTKLKVQFLLLFQRPQNLDLCRVHRYFDPQNSFYHINFVHGFAVATRRYLEYT